MASFRIENILKDTTNKQEILYPTTLTFKPSTAGLATTSADEICSTTDVQRAGECLH